MAKKAIVRGRIYREKGDKKVMLRGAVYRQSSPPPVTGPALLVVGIPI